MNFTADQIYIIGAGAIGKALSVFLRLSGRDVTLLRASVYDGGTHREFLQVRMPDGTAHGAEVRVSALDSIHKLEGLLVLANKSFGNETLAGILKEKAADSPIVLLQNGLGVEKPFLRQGLAEVYRGVLFVTSQPGEGAEIIFKPVAPSQIGVERGSADRLEEIVRLLHTPQFGFEGRTDIATTVWKKAVINSVFNTVCPLLDVDNGIFHRSGPALALARRVISECVAIANAKGIGLVATDVERSLLEISRFSDGQIISTLQDIRAGRRTELDTLNFEIVRIAQEAGLPEVPRETALLGELTRLKENLNKREVLTNA